MHAIRKIANRSSRTWLAQVLLLAFVCRALIPTGFMPDMSALSKGVFKVVVCSGNSMKVVALDADGKPVEKSGAHTHQPCAFSGLASVAVPVIGGNLPAPVFAHVATLKANAASLLPPARAGPQLGSRGPPLFS